MSDESYPDLSDVTPPEETVEPSIQINDEDDTHVLGRPPSDGYSSDGDETGSSEFDFKDATVYVEEPTVDLDAPSPPPLSNNLISAEGTTEERPDAALYSDIFVQTNLQHFFAASLCSNPLFLRKGFSPENIDKCIGDMMGFGLETAANLLLGEKVFNALPNKSKTEMCHALARCGWLKDEKNGFFHPVIPESEKEMIEQMIDGAELLHHTEENKKKEAELFPSEEAEINALLTYNMICELMVAVMSDQQRNVLQYQHIMDGFKHMVTGLNYSNLLVKYRKAGLKLDPDEEWKGEWFKKYTNRSTLKKFVTMPKFSGIVCDSRKGSEFEFRNARNGESVRLFTADDIKEVRDRWSRGNDNNRNGRFQGRRDFSRPPRGSQSKVREADPNYHAPTLSGGIDNGNAVRNDNRERMRNESLSPPRRNDSPSPVRSTAITPPPSSRPFFNPFGGPSTAPLGGVPDRAAPSGQSKQVSNFDSNGYSSHTDDEISSTGSYSDESEGAKKKRLENRERKNDKRRRNKEERDKERANRTSNPQTDALDLEFTKLNEPDNRAKIIKYTREQMLSVRGDQNECFDFKVASNEMLGTFWTMLFNVPKVEPSRNEVRNRFAVSSFPGSAPIDSRERPATSSQRQPEKAKAPGLAISVSSFNEDHQGKNEASSDVAPEEDMQKQEEKPTIAPPAQPSTSSMKGATNPRLREQQLKREQQTRSEQLAKSATELKEPERARGGFTNRRTHEPNSREQPKAPEYTGMNTRRSSPESEYRGMNAHAPSAQPPQSHPQEHPRNEYRGMNNADQSGQPQGYHTQNDYQPNEYRGMNQGQSSQPFGRHRASYDNLHQRERPDYQHNINRQSPPTFEHSERYGQPSHTHGQNQAPPYHHHEYRPNGNPQSSQYQSYPRSYQNGPDPQYAPPPPPQHNQQPYGSYNHPQQAPPPSSHWNGSDFNRGSQWGSHHNGNDGASAPYDPRRAVPRGVQRTNQGVSIFGQGFSNDEKRAIMKAAVAITNFIESQRQPVTDFILRDAHRNRYFETAFNMDPVDFVREHAQNINVEKLLVNGIWTNVYSVDC